MLWIITRLRARRLALDQSHPRKGHGTVAALMEGTDVLHRIIPHDGHPTALTNQRVAGDLKRHLIGP